MINRLPWHKKLRTSSANNLDKINEVIDYINHSDISEVALSETVSGRNVQAGKAASLKDLTVYGESIQDGTPTPSAPVPMQVVEGRNLIIPFDSASTISGITITPQNDGSVLLNGTSTTDSAISVTIGTTKVSAGITYTSSIGNYAGTGISNFGLAGFGTAKTITPTTDFNYCGINVYIPNGTAVTNVRIYPQIEVGSTATPFTPVGCIGLQIGDTVTPIDLQGNVLASLPDGTKDELKIDSAGHVVVEKNVYGWNMRNYANDSHWIKSGSAINGYYISSSFITPTPKVGTYGNALCNCATAKSTTSDYFTTINSTYIDTFLNFNLDSAVVGDNVDAFKTWLASNDLIIFTALATPTTIDLGYITPPAIATDDEIQIIANITPLIDVGYWSYPEFTEMITDLKAYVNYEIAESES